MNIPDLRHMSSVLRRIADSLEELDVLVDPIRVASHVTQHPWEAEKVYWCKKIATAPCPTPRLTEFLKAARKRFRAYMDEHDVPTAALLYTPPGGTYPFAVVYECGDIDGTVKLNVNYTNGTDLHEGPYSFEIEPYYFNHR